MHDARRMHGGEALGEARRQYADGIEGKRAVIGDRVGQRGAGHIRGDEPWLRAVRVGVDHSRGEYPADAFRSGHLVREPAAEIGIVS
jgi:hypothetical protein